MEEQPIPTKTVRAWEAMGFVWELLFVIAAPTVLCALGGRWLDERLHSSPWFTVGGLVVALAISALLVFRMAKRFSKLMKGPS